MYIVLLSDKILKGKINIAGATIVDVPKGEKSFMFEIRCSRSNGDGEVLELNAANAIDKTSWLQFLEQHAMTASSSESTDHIIINDVQETRPGHKELKGMYRINY